MLLSLSPANPLGHEHFGLSEKAYYYTFVLYFYCLSVQLLNAELYLFYLAMKNISVHWWIFSPCCISKKYDGNGVKCTCIFFNGISPEKTKQININLFKLFMNIYKQQQDNDIYTCRMFFVESLQIFVLPLPKILFNCNKELAFILNLSWRTFHIYMLSKKCTAKDGSERFRVLMQSLTLTWLTLQAGNIPTL